MCLLYIENRYTSYCYSGFYFVTRVPFDSFKLILSSAHTLSLES